MDTQKLLRAFEKIAADPDRRSAFVRHLVAFEKDIARPGFDAREEISGPLADAVFDDDQLVRKELADGTVFEFLYRSKIARDFLMSDPAVPDHAWEPQTTRMLLTLASGATTVLVGGAYFGDHAILIARQIAAAGGTVHAFEPNNDQRRMLMHNAALNGLTNIVPRSEGLWDTGEISLALTGYDSFASPTTAEAGAADSFQAITIDSYLKAVGVGRLDLLMLDIEGAEHKALLGAKTFLSQAKGEAPNIVFEVHRHYVDWTDGLENTPLVRFLTGLGYQVFALRDFNSNQNMAEQPIEIIPCAEVYLEGPPHGFNMVAVKDPALFDGPGFRIVRGVSPKLLRHKDPSLHHPLGGF
jgi:FkbM family methyltransferase